MLKKKSGMMKIKKFSEFKKRPKTKIKKVSDAPYTFVPNTNAMSPTPVPTIQIK